MIGAIVVVLSIVATHWSDPSLILPLFFSSKPSRGPWWQGLEVQQKRTPLRGSRRGPQQVRLGLGRSRCAPRSSSVGPRARGRGAESDSFPLCQ